MFKIGQAYKKAERKVLHEADKPLLLSIFILVVTGLVFLSSASAVVAYAQYGSSYHFLNRQLAVLAGGLVFFYIFYKIDYHIWRQYAFLFLGLSCVLLSLVFIPGLASGQGSARSWLNIFGFSLQPSEFVKISFLIYLAAWLESRKKDLHDVRQGAAPFFLVLSLIAFLMVLQPDIGTLSIIGATALTVYFVGGGRITHLLVVVLLAALALGVMVHFKSYQLQRFECFINSSADTAKECYQLNQSLIAVGSGGFFGRGLGQSRQKFMYLPEVSKDSIFAVMAEEVGFLFTSLFVVLCLLIFYRALLTAKNAPDQFGRLLAVGIAVWFIVQALINIGGIIGLMPMTGVPLPLVSQGGSNLLAFLVAFGLLLNISRQTLERPAR